MTKQNAIVYDDEIAEVRKKRKVDFGEFQAIGRVTSMYDKQPVKSDIFKRLRQVNKSAFDLFDDLKDTRNPYTNMCHIPINNMSASQLKMFRSRIKELKDVDIIRKARTIDEREPIPKNSYMINPHLIKCVSNPEGSIDTWNLLK